MPKSQIVTEARAETNIVGTDDGLRGILMPPDDSVRRPSAAEK